MRENDVWFRSVFQQFRPYRFKCRIDHRIEERRNERQLLGMCASSFLSVFDQFLIVGRLLLKEVFESFLPVVHKYHLKFVHRNVASRLFKAHLLSTPSAALREINNSRALDIGGDLPKSKITLCCL